MNSNLMRQKNQASQIIAEAKESALKESEKLIKATEDKIQQEIKNTEERISKEKNLAIAELNDQLKDSASTFLSKITSFDKGNIKI